jgi:type II secretory pathway pseudopilin PulG
MPGNFIQSRFKDCRGLTLIEVCFGIIILGLLLLPMAKLYDIYRIKEVLTRSDGNIQVIQSALQKYALRNGRYPIPAQRDLAPDDAGFGQEYAGAIGACGGGDVVPCRTAGFNATNDDILIGDVPFATLGLPQMYITDGYGNKFTYAVTENQTVDPPTPGIFDDKGSIRVVDDADGDTNGTNGDIHFVVLSHGEDGKGAFSLEGVLIQACAGAGADIENCDNDGEFNNNFAFIDNDTPYGRLSVAAAGANYYDDYLRFSISASGDIWSRSPSTPDIHNRNGTGGNILVGPLADFNSDGFTLLAPADMDADGTPESADRPSQKVLVSGYVRGDALLTNRLCNFQDGCETVGGTGHLVGGGPYYAREQFHPGVIAGMPNPANANVSGGGIYCGANRAMTGIDNVDERCTYNRMPALPAGVSNCPPNTWTRGVTAAGQLNCIVP